MSNRVHELLKQLKSYVWDADLVDMPRPQRVFIFVLRVMHMLLRELLGGQLNLRAMSLVYTTLLSIVPLLAVSFSVLKGFGVHNRIEPLLFNFLQPLGPKGADITANIISFVENVQVGVLGSVGLALLIYTVIALVQKIEAAFNFVWQIEHLRPLSQRISNYLSVILVGPALIFVAIGISAYVFDMDLTRKLVAIEPLGTVVVFLGKLLPYVLVCFAFTVIYIFIPNTRVHFFAALVGGVIAGVIWKIAGWGFAAFIATSTKYAAIYSSFAIMILLLIWVYLSWLILLVGSQIAFFVQHPKYMTMHRVRFVLSSRLREQIAFQIMYLVAYNHHHKRPPWNLDQLVDYLNIPGEPIHLMIRALVDAGYLLEIDNNDPPVYLPLHDIDTIRLVDLLTDIRAAGESRFLSLRQLTPVRAIDALMAEVMDSSVAALGERTLKSLVLDADTGLEPGIPALK
ncbi:MAG: YihY/virulence factor BrkB family protein [Gammaproteobacteria bacterium]